MWGWLESTGNWFADKYNDVSEGVNGWANGVRETTNDIWDIYNSSDFQAEDGIWTLNTDLDEITDLVDIPGLALDKEASDNEVQMEINRNTGEVILKCSSLAISSMNFQGLTTQGVTLSGVTITVQNASKDLGWLGTVSAKKGGAANATQDVSIHAQKIMGTGIKIQDPNIQGGTPITLDQIELQDFRLSSKGSKDIFENSPNQASFSVSSAILSGLNATQSGEQVHANLAMSNMSGAMNTSDGSAGIQVEDIQANQLAMGSNSVESSQIKGLQANVTTDANGHQQSLLSADSMAIRNVDTDMFDTTGADINNISAGFNSGTQSLTAGIGNFRAHNIDAMGTQASGVTGNNLNISSNLDTARHSGSVSSIVAQNIEHAHGSAEQVSLSNLAGAHSSFGSTATLDSARVNNLQSNGHNVDMVTMGNVSVSNMNDTQGIQVERGGVHGYSSEHGSAERFLLNDLNASQNSGNLTASLGSANLTNASSMGHTVSGAHLGSSSLTHNSTTNSISSDELSIRDYKSELGSAESLALKNIRGGTQDGTSHLTVGSGTGLNIASTSGPSLESLDIQNLQGSNQNGMSRLSLDSVSAGNVGVSGSTTERLTASNISAHGNNNLTESGFNVGNINAQNISHAAGQISSVDINGIQGNRTQKNGDLLSASIQDVTANGTNVSLLGSADTITGRNAQVSATLGNTVDYNASLDSLALDNINGTVLEAHADNATFLGATISGRNTDSLHASLDRGEVSNVNAGGVSVEQAAVTGTSFDFTEGSGSMGVNQMMFQNGQYQDGVHVEEGMINGLNIHGNAETQSGSIQNAGVSNVSVIQPQSRTHLDAVGLNNASFQHLGNGKGSINVDELTGSEIQTDIADLDKAGSSASNTGTSQIANIDMDELIATGAHRLDNANIQAQVGMHHGTIGSGIAAVDVEGGTVLNANINVANNQIQDGSRVTANKALDTVAFTSVDGGYVEDGELKADVNNWFDMGISGDINSAMGLNGDGLHSLGTYAEAVGNIPKSDGPGMNNPLDLSTLRAEGSASLSDGRVSAGDASLNLAGQNSGSNQMTFTATQTQIAMKFAQLLASSFQLKTEQGIGSTGEIKLDDSSLTVNPQQGTARGLIDSISVSDISVSN